MSITIVIPHTYTHTNIYTHTHNLLPNSAFWSSLALLNLFKPSLILGITKKCVGPCGLISLNAIHKSSSKIISAGISLATSLSKKVGAAGLIAGSLLSFYINN